MTNLPPNTVSVGAAVYYDAETLMQLTKSEWARRRALQWRDDHDGEWPSVTQLAIAADVGHGTAQRALRAVQEAISA